MRTIGESELADVGFGAALLGTGGGGNPYLGWLIVREAVRAHGAIDVVAPDEIDDDALVMTVATMGAPTVLVEKLPTLGEYVRALEAVEQQLGRRADLMIPVEIGGVNSMAPLGVAALRGIPVVDADYMGRAYPELQMVLPTLYDISAAPLAMADDKGNTAILSGVTNQWSERLARPVLIEMGCVTAICLYTLTGAQVKQAAVPATLTLARELGAAARAARAAHEDVVEALLEPLDGRRLFGGKIADIHHKVGDGFTRAECRIDGLDADDEHTLTLSTQNEHLLARLDDGTVLASTPDLIMVLDVDTGEPITTEELRYGRRVAVIAAPCDPRWRSEAGLALAGPRYFGYDIDFVPVEDTQPTRSR